MGDANLEKVIEERRRERERALREAKKFADCVAEKLGRITVILYGSYARGDFNEWSDIDVLVVAEENLPRNPLRRLDLIEDCLKQAPTVEPLLLTIDELERLVEKRNPAVVEALSKGTPLVNGLSLVGRPQLKTS